ncbi:hypothetical protein V8B97DRAFT_1962442 [Scleroderma yunnanense]
MLKNINSMTNYATSVALIQSSGTGKSRVVHEQANLVFTIPFNLRDPEERYTGAYPPEDAEVWSYLCSTSEVKSMQHGMARVALFFGHLFSEVTAEVKRVFRADDKLSPCDLACRWRAHLSRIPKRSQLYARVIKACNNDKYGLKNDVWILGDPAIKLRALLMALHTVCNFPKSDDVKVMLYFDEAHELHRIIPGDEQGQTLYDIMWLSLARFQSPSVFTIFLSTQPALLAPSAETAQTALTLQRTTNVLQAPITETSFDCHPDLPLAPGQLKLEDLGELPFLARFGRPLFWALIETAKGDRELVDAAMRLARLKLVRDDIWKPRHSDMGMLAVLDVLITVNYDPRRDSARKTEFEMVASHMRTAFSIPAHRLYICSGYPSEPFLAEAASRQMYHYLRMSDRFPQNRMACLLKKYLDDGLIDPSQKGEMVVRVLLRQAYMDSIVAEHANENPQAPEPNFSKGCGFLQFLNALFADSLHTLILKSEPDNKVESCCALEDAFEHAVIRFTHFISVADDSTIKTSAMISGFLRGVAFIVPNCQNSANIVIPILLDKRSALDESSMSALFIQIKRRQRSSSVNGIIDQTVRFFPNRVSTPQQDSRPYVTLVTELGANAPPRMSSNVRTDHNYHTSARAESNRMEKHPRYNIRAYGCTDAAWKVINVAECDLYKQVLGTDDLLADHPRQDAASLQLVHRMLPFWHGDAKWLFDELKSTETVQPSAAVVVGSYEELMEQDESTEILRAEVEDL